MKKVVLQSVFFFVLAFAFYAVNTVLINRIYISGKRAACWVNPQFAARGGQDYLVTHFWDTSASYDVVVAGSSHAYRGYDPRIFSKHRLQLYTIGTGYQNTAASYVLLKNDCQLKPGTLLILDLFDNTFTGDGMGCFSRLIPNAHSAQTAFDLMLVEPDLRLLNAYCCYLASDQHVLETAIKDGFVYNGYSETKDSSRVAMDTTDVPADTYEFEDKYLNYLEKIVELARSHQCQMVLASHPALPTPTNKALHAAFVRYLQPFVQRHGLAYLDFSFRNGFDPNVHFMDSNHLNQTGVDAYNALLIDTLQKMQLVKPNSQ